MLAGLLLAACTARGSAPDAQSPAIEATNDASASVEDAPSTSEGSPNDTGAGVELPWDAPMLPLPCNGSPSYCEKRYDELCQVATHDSAADSAVYWMAPAQDRSLRAQLDNSIRVLTLTVAEYQSVVSVCQEDCAEGNTPLALVLDTVKGFLDVNPREVVTLLIDTTVPAIQLASEFAAKKLDALAHTQAVQASWPMLGDMITAGHRLVVLSSSSEGGPAWLLSRQAFLWETGREWTSLAAMTCNPAVGNSSRPLYLVHHDLVEPSDGAGASPPSIVRAAEANARSTVLTRLQQCAAQFGHAPNYVAIDFFEIGDAQGATMVVNGGPPPPSGLP